MLVYVVKMWGSQKVFKNRERAISECKTSLKRFLDATLYSAEETWYILNSFHRQLYVKVEERNSYPEEWYEFSVYECVLED